MADEIVIRKSEDDGFRRTHLARLLRERRVTAVSICGLMSEMCVAATARGALDRGYRVLLAHDAHATNPVPPHAPGEPEVPAAQAARVAEWSLGDAVVIVARSSDMRFTASSG